MASIKRRLHRRKRRAARVQTRVTTRFMTKCVDADGKACNHWVYVTDKGDIWFRDHPHITIREMAAQGQLQLLPVGCPYFAKRLVQAVLVDYSEAQVRAATDKRVLSCGTAALLRKLDSRKSRRVGVAASVERIRMLPLPESLQYRQELLIARFQFRVRTLVDRLLERAGQPHCVDRTFGGVHGRWDY
jgi:hypothetical protein